MGYLYLGDGCGVTCGNPGVAKSKGRPRPWEERIREGRPLFCTREVLLELDVPENVTTDDVQVREVVHRCS